MTRINRYRYLMLLLSAGLGACGGGGGGGDDGAAALVVRITATGVAEPLWQGVTVAPPYCAGPVLQNSVLVFTFGGAVDAASLPPAGAVQGSITIATGQGTPLSGTLLVEDDPSLAPGNRRRVVFRPPLPGSPAAITSTGIVGPQTYLVRVPAAGAPGPLVTVGGQPLGVEVITCFTVCDPGVAGCFTDNMPGVPFVTSTSPETGDPPPPPTACVLAGNRFTVLTSEPLLPQGIDAGTVRLRNVVSGAQVPGSVVFFQAGTPEAGPDGARIDYVAQGPLPSGVTFELTLASTITDFGGNPLATYAPGSPSAPASARRLFTTVATPFSAQPPITEDFSTTASLGSVTGAAVWAGDGVVTVRSPEELLGNGAFGVLAAPLGPSTLDAGMPPIVVGGQVAFENGVWNTTAVNIPSGALVRAVGHANGNLWRVHLRSLGVVNISGIVNASAGTSAGAPLGTPEQGPGFGGFNNGFPGGLTWVAGGVGGVGGGRGGNASQADQNTAPQRTFFGESGFGPPVNGVLNPGPPGANPYYGGGQGGQGGFLAGQGGQPGELGGLGGAGGSAWEAGRDGGPFGPSPPCVPLAVSPQTRALATGVPPVFATPVSIQSAGSGGGGGGDKFENPGVDSDDQGGGGGGGGGGFRISSLNNIDFGPAGILTCDGATGSQGNVFNGGGGGGGSGGEIWLQSLAQVVISSTASLTVNRGFVGNNCSDQGAGPGAFGLYQFEDADGIVNTGFVGPFQGLNHVVVTPIAFGDPVTGVAVSGFFDTGSSAPDYASATETSNPGNLSGASIAITYQGAHETVAGGAADPTTITAPFPAVQIDQIDGYRFVRFTITITYPLLPLPPAGAILPVVDAISIGFSAAAPCP